MEEDNIKTIAEDGKKEKKKLHGFKLTFGRCFDFFIIAINIIVFVFSFIAFICISILTATSAAAVTNIANASSSQACILFASADTSNDVIVFSSNNICYFILVSPPIIWCFLVFFTLFLSIKICRAWKIGFFEIIICGVSIVCLIFAVIAALVLSLGHRITCDNVAQLNVPTTTTAQSCDMGGAYYTETEMILFVGFLDAAEATLWISCIVLIIISLIHFLRIVVFSRRKINKEKKRTKSAMEDRFKKEQQTTKADETQEKPSS